MFELIRFIGPDHNCSLFTVHCSLLTVNSLLYLLVRHAVFNRNILGVADALRRQNQHLKAALAVVYTRDKALYPAFALG